MCLLGLCKIGEVSQNVYMIILNKINLIGFEEYCWNVEHEIMVIGKCMPLNKLVLWWCVINST